MGLEKVLEQQPVLHPGSYYASHAPVSRQGASTVNSAFLEV